MDRDDILTAEAVWLDANAASFGARMAAAAIDVLAGGLAFGIVLIPVSALTSPDMDVAAGVALATAIIVAYCVILPALVETLTRGRSLGKLALGYRIIRDDGGPSGGREAFVRALVGLVELWGTVGGLAIVSALMSKRGKRLGDYLAGTYAVRVRAPAARTASISMPPELAGWAQVADMSRLPDTVALRARMVLTRHDRFSSVALGRVAAEVARDVAPHVAPPPPEGTTPHRFLAAVLAERAVREAQALAERGRRAGALLSGTTRLGYGVDDPPT